MAKFYEIADDQEEAKIVKSLHSNPGNVNDSKSNNNIELDKDIVAYNILTTSDKVINNRIYPDAEVQLTVLDKRWLQSYPKPFLKNHDIYEEALGRIIDTAYVDHKSMTQKGGTEEIPQKVIDFFAAKNSFKNGAGSVIGKIVVTGDTVEKIKNSIYYTTSQSSRTDGYTCNICGSDYYECSHYAGNEYEVETNSGKQTVTCYPKTGALYPTENSAVNTPANDTSILCLYDSKSDMVVPSAIDNFIPSTTSENNSDSQKQSNIISDSSENKTINEKGEETVSKDLEARIVKLKDNETKVFTSTVDFLTEDKKKTAVDDFEKIEALDLQYVNDIVKIIIAEKDSAISTKETLIADLTAKLTDANSKILELQKTADVEMPKTEEQKDAAKPVVEAVVEDEKDAKEKVPNIYGDQTSEKKTKTITQPKSIQEKYSIKK